MKNENSNFTLPNQVIQDGKLCWLPIHDLDPETERSEQEQKLSLLQEANEIEENSKLEYDDKAKEEFVKHFVKKNCLMNNWGSEYDKLDWDYFVEQAEIEYDCMMGAEADEAEVVKERYRQGNERCRQANEGYQ